MWFTNARKRIWAPAQTRRDSPSQPDGSSTPGAPAPTSSDDGDGPGEVIGGGSRRPTSTRSTTGPRTNKRAPTDPSGDGDEWWHDDTTVDPTPGAAASAQLPFPSSCVTVGGEHYGAPRYDGSDGGGAGSGAVAPAYNRRSTFGVMLSGCPDLQSQVAALAFKRQALERQLAEVEALQQCIVNGGDASLVSKVGFTL